MRATTAIAAASLIALTGYVALDAVDVLPGVLTSDLGAPERVDRSSPPGPAPPPPADDASRGPADPSALPVAALDPEAPRPDPGVLRAVLTPLLADPALGSSLGIDVRDGLTGELLHRQGADQARPPASLTKVFTAAAVAARTDLHGSFVTRVVRGARPGDVVLVAGGDNLLDTGQGRPGAVTGRAGVDALAARTIAALNLTEGRQAPVRVLLDDSFAAGPALAPGWEAAEVASGLTGPVAMLGLATDRAMPGRPSTPDPALTAASAFRDRLADRLAAAGVDLAPTVTRAPAPAGAAELARVSSAPIGEVMALALAESDNDLTESIARYACVGAGVAATFEACAAWVHEQVAALGVDVARVRLVDTSGLSSGTRIPVRTVADVLALAGTSREPALADIVVGLPVAGLTGTLADRYRAGPARSAAGIVRAKTGTLIGVDSLGGTLVDADGRLLVFAVIADATPPGGTSASRAALDRLAAALAACGCRAPATGGTGAATTETGQATETSETTETTETRRTATTTEQDRPTATPATEPAAEATERTR